MTHASTVAAPDVMPPPESFNFAQHVLALNAGRAARPAYIDDTGTLSYGQLAERVRSVAAGLRSLRCQARGAGAPADARRHRLAGRVPRRDLRGRRAGRRQHTADGRRLRLHARTFARAGRPLSAARSARAEGRADEVGPRSPQSRRVAADRAARTSARSNSSRSSPRTRR